MYLTHLSVIEQNNFKSAKAEVPSFIKFHLKGNWPCCTLYYQPTGEDRYEVYSLTGGFP